MKMIAIGTVHGRKEIRAADPRNPKSKAKYQDIVVAPGHEFDTEELGVSAEEAQQLISNKAAKQKTREVADDGDKAASEKIPA
jgi:hypothetical protein